jgi:hypothetical protein
VTWDFLEHWGHIKAPAAIVRYEDMLFPQYEETFTSIDKDTWKHLRKKVRANLRSGELAAESVVEHWRSIADGNVPFGLSVRD